MESIESEEPVSRKRLPTWLRRPPGSDEQTQPIKKLLRRASLNTVCEEARCPNIAECFGRKTATFMILGDVCTRGCRFCSINTGKPVFRPEHFKNEALKVRESVEALGLKHVVVTSVARDDLEDGGASGFVDTISELKSLGGVTVEILIPDFRGDLKALAQVVEAGPDVLNHNLETVPRLYRKVRPGTSYERSLKLLKSAKEMKPTLVTKTGIMLGLGEREEEVLQLLDDCRAHDIDAFTAGQYLQPTRDHLEVQEYVSPEKFRWYEDEVRKRDFRFLAVGPLVRSSYRADEFIRV